MSTLQHTLGEMFLRRGYSQRLIFAVYFAWMLIVAILLLQERTTPASVPPSET